MARGARLRRVRRRAPADRRADRGDGRVGEAGHAAGRSRKDADAPQLPRGLAPRHAGPRAANARRLRPAGERPGHLPQLRDPDPSDRGQVGARRRIPPRRAQGRAPCALRVRRDRRRREAGRQGRQARVRRHGHGRRRRRHRRIGAAGRMGGRRDAGLPARRRGAAAAEGIRHRAADALSSDRQTGNRAGHDRHLLRRPGARAPALSGAGARALRFRRGHRHPRG